MTLIRLARKNIVYIVMHDPSPLRRAYGQSRWARRLFKAVIEHKNFEVLYHTEHAQMVGFRESGVEGIVVPHPVGFISEHADYPPGGTASQPLVRVLGQYKDTRSLTSLATIANRAAGSCELEIHGRGWPDVPGWTVMDHFVPEEEFTALVESSDCIVVPYDLFFQSGVAVRCLEAGVPVVAPRHEHIAQLYGEEWAGTVRDESDWYDALIRALAVDTAEVRSRHVRVVRDVRSAWRQLLLTSREAAC